MMKCPISVCKVPVKKIRVYDPEKYGEEPSDQDSNFCRNANGFHDHEENIWYKFKEPKVGNERFEGRIN